MPFESSVLDPRPPSRLANFSAMVSEPGDPEKEAEAAGEESCPAFGYLRGLRDWAPMIEFRFRDGNAESFPYAWLGPVRFDPSVGLLLRFAGDVVTLVLIRGSNLAAPVGTGGVDLVGRGIQRHRVTFVREMGAGELRSVGEAGPTIDRIEVAEFETQEELRAWLKERAPGFLRSGA